MSIEQDLLTRANSACELCSATDDIKALEVSPSDGSVEKSILLCGTCHEMITDDSKMNANHFRCLSDSMWNTEPAVQVMAYRLLKQLSSEGWPQDLLEMLYLEEDVQSWADAGLVEDESSAPTKDSNGSTLQTGDSVSIIKDLEVKGAGFTAKRGTVVKSIHLVPGNPEQIEGRVNGTKIVLLTKFLKKM